MKVRYRAVLGFAIALAFVPAAMASEISFSFAGNGIQTSGIFTVASTSVAGVDEITGISGTFSDSNPNANVSGSIAGLYTPVSYVSDDLATPGVAFTNGGNSYDDTFYTGGDSPTVCLAVNPNGGAPIVTYPFSGGYLDIFGVAFNISGPGGYVANLWSNGDVGGGPIVYAAALSNANGLIDDPNAGPDSVIPPGEFGQMTVSPVPEPSSIALLGTGFLLLAGLWLGKKYWFGSARA